MGATFIMLHLRLTILTENNVEKQFEVRALLFVSCQPHFPSHKLFPCIMIIIIITSLLCTHTGGVGRARRLRGPHQGLAPWPGGQQATHQTSSSPCFAGMGSRLDWRAATNSRKLLGGWIAQRMVWRECDFAWGRVADVGGGPGLDGHGGGEGRRQWWGKEKERAIATTNRAPNACLCQFRKGE